MNKPTTLASGRVQDQTYHDSERVEDRTYHDSKRAGRGRIRHGKKAGGLGTNTNRTTSMRWQDQSNHLNEHDCLLLALP